MNHKKNSGFTLIELLVVIAIIGILAALVLVALGNARDKAQDARVKSDIGQLNTIAQVIYDNNNSSYASVEGCFTTPAAGTCFGSETNVTTLQADVNSAVAANATAHSTAAAFCVTSVLKSSASSSFCADSTGVSKVTNGTTCTGAAPAC
jgi:prepilin-type N-terminal cleavage/methylation domain-containing protein